MNDRQLGIAMLGFIGVGAAILWMVNTGAPLTGASILPSVAAPIVPAPPADVPYETPTYTVAGDSFIYPVTPFGSHSGCGRMSWCGSVV